VGCLKQFGAHVVGIKPGRQIYPLQINLDKKGRSKRNPKYVENMGGNIRGIARSYQNQ